MKTFLLWRSDPCDRRYPDPALAGDRIGRIFDPYYREAPVVQHRAAGAINLLYQELPVRGWSAPFVQEDRDRWALAIDYPVDARALAQPSGGGDPLPALCALFERQPRQVFDQISPPSSIVWHDKRRDRFFAANDGMGLAQIYEYDDGKRWALTNRISALAALGIELEADLANWATRWAINYFPLGATGFRNVRSLARGTLLSVTQTGVERTVEDVFPGWVQPQRIKKAEVIERAWQAMREYVERSAREMDPVTLSLSGGRDSRPVGAVLRGLGVEFEARTRGDDWRPDVTIAERLCEVAGVPLTRVRRETVPSDDHGDIPDAICDALVWQSGFRSRRHHHTFRAGRRGLSPGLAILTGRSGESCRHTSLIDRFHRGWPDRDAAKHVVKRALKSNRMPSFIRPEVCAKAGDEIRATFDRGTAMGLTDLQALVLFILDRDRSHYERFFASEPNLTLTPYFHRHIVNAAFSLSFGDLRASPVHSYIVATDAPDWAEIEYEGELTARLKAKSGTRIAAGFDADAAAEMPAWQRPVNREAYNSRTYWRELAAPLIEAAIDEGGPWTEIYDPDLVRANWRHSPEEFLILAMIPRAIEMLNARAR